MAPSGVQKERISSDDIFIVNLQGEVVEAPRNEALKLTACAPLFLAAMNQRQAGAVIHSHSVDAAVATRLWLDEFRIREVEMIKGLRGYGYYDTVRVPIIDNTAHECDLGDSMSTAIDENPHSDAVWLETMVFMSGDMIGSRQKLKRNAWITSLSMQYGCINWD